MEIDEEDKDSDSDFHDDDEVYLRDIRDKRIAAMKSENSQKLQDLANGHGKYQEITEE